MGGPLLLAVPLLLSSCTTRVRPPSNAGACAMAAQIESSPLAAVLSVSPLVVRGTVAQVRLGVEIEEVPGSRTLQRVTVSEVIENTTTSSIRVDDQIIIVHHWGSNSVPGRNNGTRPPNRVGDEAVLMLEPLRFTESGMPTQTMWQSPNPQKGSPTPYWYLGTSFTKVDFGGLVGHRATDSIHMRVLTPPVLDLAWGRPTTELAVVPGGLQISATDAAKGVEWDRFMTTLRCAIAAGRR